MDICINGLLVLWSNDVLGLYYIYLCAWQPKSSTITPVQQQWTPQRKCCDYLTIPQFFLFHTSSSNFIFLYCVPLKSHSINVCVSHNYLYLYVLLRLIFFMFCECAPLSFPFVSFDCEFSQMRVVFWTLMILVCVFRLLTQI